MFILIKVNNIITKCIKNMFINIKINFINIEYKRIN